MKQWWSNPSEAAEARENVAVDEAALLRRGQCSVQHMADEVDSRFHSQNHALLHQAAHPQALQPRLITALSTLRTRRTRV